MPKILEVKPLKPAIEPCASATTSGTVVNILGDLGGGRRVLYASIVPSWVLAVRALGVPSTFETTVNPKRVLIACCVSEFAPEKDGLLAMCLSKIACFVSAFALA